MFYFINNYFPKALPTGEGLGGAANKIPPLSVVNKHTIYLS
jgi:hypothetical protein